MIRPPPHSTRTDTLLPDTTLFRARIALPALTADTHAALSEVLPPLATPNNPLDVTGAAMIEPELIARSLKALAQDPQIAALSFEFDAPPKEDARGFARRFIAQIGAGFKDAGKPGVLQIGRAP